MDTVLQTDLPNDLLTDLPMCSNASDQIKGSEVSTLDCVDSNSIQFKFVYSIFSHIYIYTYTSHMNKITKMLKGE